MDHAETADDLVTPLLPLLGRSLKTGFNVFDVMRHGSHEKQISNVFGWLLDPEGTHELGDAFQRIFLDELNADPATRDQLTGPYVVRHEVNTAAPGMELDIADLVLESARERIVVENYYTSDGHGHSYRGYLNFAREDGRRGSVVLLCRDRDSSRQTGGWEDALVVTYGVVVHRLHLVLADDAEYRRKHPEAFSFIDQMHRKFIKNRGRVEDHQLLDFLSAMCANGAAGYYRWQKQDEARTKFAEDVALQAAERFDEGREVLQRIKGRLRTYAATVLQPQLNETLGPDFVTKVAANYAGIYQWSINFDVEDEGDDIGEARLQLKFGPSAWFANEQDRDTWKTTVDRATANYAYVFITRARHREIRQSSVPLQDVLDGLDADDRRLHDEIVDLWGRPGTPGPGSISGRDTALKRVVERNVGVGHRFFEIVDDEDSALTGDWDGGPVQVRTGQIRVESAANNHYPEIQVATYSSEPPPARGSRKVPLTTLGVWSVTLNGAVQVWSADSYPGDELPLELPWSPGGRYQVRVARGCRDTGDLSLEDYVDQYYDEHGEAPVGIERFAIDIWPAD